MKWILEWNNCDEPIQSGKEYFNNKEDLKERLGDLKDEYSDELEWTCVEAKLCPCCLSLVDKKTKLKIVTEKELEE